MIQVRRACGKPSRRDGMRVLELWDVKEAPPQPGTPSQAGPAQEEPSASEEGA